MHRAADQSGRRGTVRRPASGSGARRRRVLPPSARVVSGRGQVPSHDPDTSEGPGDLGAGLDLIYGRNPVREALRGRRRVHVVLLATSSQGDDLEAMLRTWCSEIDVAVPPVDRVSPLELTARLNTAEHQGVAAVVDPYPYLDPREILRSHSLLVGLDGIEDPHNLGAVIRTAEAAGAGVLIPRHRASTVTGAVVKASAGASEHAAVGKVQNLADFLAHAKKAGFWVYGAAPGADNLYTEQDYRYPTCFVLGGEGEGLGRRVAGLCDVIISLPLLGKVGSLNVSVTAGIVLYEALRQRAVGGTRG